MGVMLISKLFRIHRRVTEIAAIWGARWNMDQIPSHIDFREGIVFANLYSSLVSGYLYHRSGRECWLDSDGRPGHVPREPFEVDWDSHLVHPLPIPRHNRSLCEYLATKSTVHGLQAYIEWVFTVHYRKTLSHFALSQELPVLRNRTMVVCFENLTADPVSSSDAMLSFLFHRPPPFPRAWGSADAGGHATPATPEERESFLHEIQKLDLVLYGGAIAYANSVIPC